MKQRTRIAWNILTNYTRHAVFVAVALVVNPFLFHRLGADGYGVIALMGSTGGLLYFLDVGMAHAISRFVSKYATLEEPHAVNRIINTAIAVYTVVGLASLAVLTGVGFFLLASLGVPESVVEPGRWVFVLAGVSLAVRFPGNAFEGALKGLQRFDLSNAAQLVDRVVYASCVLVALGLCGLGLVSVAFSLVIGSVASQVVRFAGLCLAYRKLELRWGLVSWQAFTEMLRFGILAFLTQVSAFLEGTAGRFIISAALTSTVLGAYSLVMVVVGLLSQMRISIASVVMPVASKYEALQDQHKLQRLLVDGSRLVLAVVLPAAIWIMVMGKPILVTWIGPEMAAFGTVLTLMAAVQTVDLLNGVGYMVLIGIGEVRILGWTYLVGSVVGVTLLAVLVWGTNFGIYSAVVGIGASVVIRRSVVMVHMCRRVGMTTWTFVRRALLPAIASGVPAAGVAVTTRMYVFDTGWLALVCSAALTGTTYIATAWFFVLHHEERQWVVGMIRSRALRSRPSQG